MAPPTPRPDCTTHGPVQAHPTVFGTLSDPRTVIAGLPASLDGAGDRHGPRTTLRCAGG